MRPFCLGNPPDATRVAKLARLAKAGCKSPGLLDFIQYQPRLEGRFWGNVMLEYLPAELREGFDRARKKSSARSRRLSLRIGDAVFPIKRLWDDGLVVDAARLPQLRGFVEIHEGSRHILTCLIVASEVEDGDLICTFKRSTPAVDRAALDYEVETDQPAGLLTRQ